MGFRNDVRTVARSEGGFFGCLIVIVAVFGLIILLLIDWQLAAIYLLAIVGILGVAGLVWGVRKVYKWIKGIKG